MRARQKIAVVGSGISGLSAAWLLSQRHEVTLIETDSRIGGHSNTVDAPSAGGQVPVDTGFIVYNTASYPNLIALFDHLGVETAPTSMSFAVSMGGGAYEYSGSGLAGLFGQPSNCISPAHWRMITDTLRFFREAPGLLAASGDERTTLGEYLACAGYSEAFVARHILPMAAAIWSTPSHLVLGFPLAAFVRFFANHGLLQVNDRPQWRTVVGGSRQYVRKLLAATNAEILLSDGARRIERAADGVTVVTRNGRIKFDACVLATHADQALSVLADADREERSLLGAFHYQENRTILHRDPSAMPLRRRLWSSWNYIGDGRGIDSRLSVTYWMNSLQPLPPSSGDLFVTLNPLNEISPAHVIREMSYAHPVFNRAAIEAQRSLWELQGRRRTWFCGSYFGYGFHEDGLQAGLAVAEELGGIRRPWTVRDQSARIHAPPPGSRLRPRLLEAAE